MTERTLSKKRTERWALDRFLTLLGELAPDEIDETEEPDFVVGYGSRRIGVEITDLYRRPGQGKRPRQEMESLRSRIIARATQLCERRGLPPAHVSVFFNDQLPLNKAAVSALSEQIANWIATRVPKDEGSFAEEYDWRNRDHFPEELHRLQVYRFAWMTRLHLSSPDADYSRPMVAADVHQVLDRKNALYRRYLRKCESAWLVVNANTAKLSMMFEVDATIVNIAYETPVDRLFVVEHLPPRLWELRTNHEAGRP